MNEIEYSTLDVLDISNKNFDIFSISNKDIIKVSQDQYIRTLQSIFGIYRIIIDDIIDRKKSYNISTLDQRDTNILVYFNGAYKNLILEILLNNNINEETFDEYIIVSIRKELESIIRYFNIIESNELSNMTLENLIYTILEFDDRAYIRKKLSEYFNA